MGHTSFEHELRKLVGRTATIQSFNPNGPLRVQFRDGVIIEIRVPHKKRHNGRLPLHDREPLKERQLDACMRVLRDFMCDVYAAGERFYEE